MTGEVESRVSDHPDGSTAPVRPGDGSRHEPAVSVVIPTWNGQPEFGGVLDSLTRQRFPGPVEIIVVDSGSTDGTLDVARQHGVEILHVEKDAFDHGDTRNLAVAHARAPYVVILSQDAEPCGSRWLDTLVQPLRDDPQVAGVCGRIVPRPGLDPRLRRGVEEDLNYSRERRIVELSDPAAWEALSPVEQRIHLNFHDVGSCLRRAVWERLPFPRTPFGEDLMWARAVLDNGFRIVYEPKAEVLHSHDYGPGSLYRRAWWDGWLNRRLLDRRPLARGWHVAVHAIRAVAADLAYLRREGAGRGARLAAIPKSLALHGALAAGLYRGAQRTTHRPDPRRLLPDRPLRILFVVHGFPPEDLAGTEVYTWTVARALRDRGHAVAVFHRVSAPDDPEYEVREAEFDGLKVYRLVNDFRYQGITETYRNPHVEERFREVVAREQPDVVHFQHCLHTSVSLIGLSEDMGLPTVVTLNDFWFICPTVQMIVPDRSLCRVSRAGLSCLRCARWDDPRVRAAWPWLRALAGPGRLWPRLRDGVRRRLLGNGTDAARDAEALTARPREVRAHLRRAGRVLAPSRFLRQQYIAFGLDPEQIIYQRYGIRTRELAGAPRTARAPRTGPLRVGFIGSFVWYKGLHVLIEAFQGVRSDQAALTVYGDPEQPPEVRDYAAQCRQKAEGRPVRFTGRLAQADLVEAHRNLDVLVVPSLWYENSPLVILEAQAAGTPVLTSNLGGMAELVRDGVNGYVFPPGDAAALRRRILDLAARPEILDAMRRTLPRPKDISLNIRELEALYRQEASRPRPASGQVPFWWASGPRYADARGRVEVQGQDLALLRPGAGETSSVTYCFQVDRPGPVRLEVNTCLLAGETDVVLSGSLYWNETLLGRFPPHRAGPSSTSVRQHVFTQVAEPGPVELRISNAGPGETASSTYLRVQRIRAFHESRESPSC